MCRQRSLSALLLTACAADPAPPARLAATNRTIPDSLLTCPVRPPAPDGADRAFAAYLLLDDRGDTCAAALTSARGIG